MSITTNGTGTRTLGAYVRAAREAAGLSQTATAEACGFSRQTVGMVEGDSWAHARVSDRVLDALARVLPSADRDELYALADKLPPELRTMTPGEMRQVRAILNGQAFAHPVDGSGRAPVRDRGAPLDRWTARQQQRKARLSPDDYNGAGGVPYPDDDSSAPLSEREDALEHVRQYGPAPPVDDDSGAFPED